MTHTGATVRDDGFVKAGGALSYQDNGDGTVTDLNTLLMWEKKSMDGSLHDVNKFFLWSSPVTDTVWDWIDAVNTELGTGIGFAGYNDWRLANVKELQSIVDYGRSDPAVDPAFNNNVSAGCTVLTCSATRSAGGGPPPMADYWSSTNAGAFSMAAWVVQFRFGSVSIFSWSFPFQVRAVRGGCVP